MRTIRVGTRRPSKIQRVCAQQRCFLPKDPAFPLKKSAFVGNATADCAGSILVSRHVIQERERHVQASFDHYSGGLHAGQRGRRLSTRSSDLRINGVSDYSAPSFDFRLFSLSARADAYPHTHDRWFASISASNCGADPASERQRDRPALS